MRAVIYARVSRDDATGRSAGRSPDEQIDECRAWMEREGIVEANLQALNARFDFQFLEELVRIKTGGERSGVAADGNYFALCLRRTEVRPLRTE